MAPAFRFSTITEAQQYEELRRAYPRLHAAIERAFPPNQTPRPDLFLRDASLAADLAQATARWPRLLAGLVKRGGSPAASTAIPSGRLGTAPAAPTLALTAPAAAPKAFLRAGDMFALRFRNSQYLIADGSSWEWTSKPEVHWTFKLDNGTDGVIGDGSKVGLYNEDTRAFLCAEGSMPTWMNFVGYGAFCWVVRGHGDLPYIRLMHESAANDRALYYDSYYEHLRVMVPNEYPQTKTLATDPNIVIVKQASAAERISFMPCYGDLLPGEAAFMPDRPETWTVECWEEGKSYTVGTVDADEPGLEDRAYKTLTRSPYIQDVTPTSAVVRWRIALPAAALAKGSAPALKLLADNLEVRLAPVGVSLSGKELLSPGTVFTKGSPNVTVRNCSDDYLTPFTDTVAGQRRNVDPARVRPTSEYEVRFKYLEPATH
ncbi:MAG: hypothetical protein FJ087_19860 [Deltaproteobacteria bacterium]|nr:hypothetical protein [Deltaproteobacteria bacterium]